MANPFDGRACPQQVAALKPFVDVHCHLIPAIDDGAADWDATLAMARMAVADGIETIICTPHQLGAFHHNHGDDIRRRTSLLQAQLEEHQIPLRVLPGGDVRIESDMIEKLLAGEVLSLADRRRHVLLELPHELYFPIDDVLRRLEKHGMQGILSHPERNQGLLKDWELTFELVQRGCLMQVTAGSLHGTFGPNCQKMAQWMVEHRLVHFVATDAHSPKARRPLMRRAFDAVERLGGRELALSVCCENPAAVVAGKRTPIAEPITPRKRNSFSWLPWRRAA